MKLCELAFFRIHMGKILPQHDRPATAPRPSRASVRDALVAVAGQSCITGAGPGWPLGATHFSMFSTSRCHLERQHDTQDSNTTPNTSWKPFTSRSRALPDHTRAMQNSPQHLLLTAKTAKNLKIFENDPLKSIGYPSRPLFWSQHGCMWHRIYQF